MIKRLVGWSMVVCMLTGLLGIGSMAGAEAMDLPAVGDTLQGFTVTDIREERIIDCQAVTLTHDRTGAQVLYIAADDVDAAFDISFRTPNMNNEGIPHVFEHITISGSDKYPAQNLFFPIATQTYTTFVNAMTMQRMTTYPLSSLSDAQLLKLADYYLDGVFNPMIYQDERYFQREAWRYELKDVDGPMTLTGTVYNEMRGHQNIQSAAGTNLLRALYPNSIIGNVNGGDPDHIPEMTYQALLDFHDAYYHPSNSLTVLYGRLDLDAFLGLLDGYFSQYDEKAFDDIEMGRVPLRDTFFEAVYSFPVEAGSPMENASVVSYAFVLPGAEYEKGFDISVLVGLLTHESSPLTRAIRERLPNAQFNAGVDMDQPDPYLVFMLDGANAEDRTVFKEIVDESLRQIAEEGIHADLIDAMIAAQEFSTLLIPETTQLGVNLAITLANAWANHGTTDYMNITLDRLAAIKEMAHEGYFEQLLRELLLENPHAVLIATEPAPGDAEKKTADLQARLAAIKDAMSDEEKARMVEEGKAFDAWAQAEAPKSMIESLQAVTTGTLPEEIKRYDIHQGEIDGVHTLTTHAATAGIGQSALYLDTSALPLDLLHYYNLYISLIGMVDTESHERAELQTLMTRYLNRFQVITGKNWYANDTWNPSMSCSWMSLMEDYEPAVELVRELLFTSQINDLSILQTVIMQSQLTARNTLNTAGYIEQMQRATAVAHEDEAYAEYLSGLAYYEFLKKAETMLQQDPDTLVANLQAARDALMNKQNAVLLFAGNDEGLAAFEAHAGGLFAGIQAAPIEMAPMKLPRPAAREALIVDATIQYNLISAPLKDMDIEYSAKFQALSSLIYDAYLTPQIRHGIGAYDNITFFDRRSFTFFTYRDPSIAESFKVYEGLPAFAAEAEVTQEDIDRYIVSAYSGYATPQGDLTGAMNALTDRLLGWPDDQKLIDMRQIKQTTVQDLRALAPAFEKMLENGTRSTSGGAAIIEAHADLYDEILNLQSTAAEAGDGAEEAEDAA